MHNNFYFLKQLSASLDARLAGAVISECFSQNKDELIIRFETSSTPFFFRAALHPEFCCLSFPGDFNRARKNSIDLFEGIIGRRVLRIETFRNERSFALQLSEDHSLIFKMHGNRSNIILLEKDCVTRIFKNSLDADKLITMEGLNREIDFGQPAFLEKIDNLKNLYVTFGKVIWSYLEYSGFNSQSTDEKWLTIQHLLSKLNRPPYFITDLGEGPLLSLVEYGTIQKQFDDPIATLNEFYHTYIQSHAFYREKEKLLSEAKGKLHNSQNYLKKTETKLTEIENDTRYKMWADLIMANLHEIKTVSDKIILADFATNKPVEIKLKKDLSPQMNAELFYKKSKNQHIEIEHLKKAVQEKKNELTSLQNLINTIDSASDLKQLRKEEVIQKDQKKKEKAKEPLPYFEFEFHGFKIWVGRNAQSNDVLTLKHGYKEDLWLHAKDVAGSHVLIKYQAGKGFPKNVIERAAQLAAYNSKRKNESLCPVTVTPRKFVRKRKGDPAGAVVVEREEVILVEPMK